MEILVHGRNVVVEKDVEEAAGRKAERFGRLATDIRRTEVEFREVRNPREPYSHVCEINVHLTKNLVKAHAEAQDQRTALDRAVAKAEHQLSKVHSKRISRAKPKHPPEPVVG